MMKRFLIFAAMVAMTATAAMAQSVDDIAERAYDLLKAKNYDAAFPLMLQAAEKGDCVSMGNLGTMYYKGLGTDVDYNQALRWWGKAEEKGCGSAIKAYRDELIATKSFVVDGVRYIVNPDFTAMIKDYSVQNGAKTIIVPKSVDYNGRTYRVTSIGYRVFAYCSGLKSVTIPNSVTEIGNSAFYGCSGLTSVTIGNSVTSIGEWAFRDCSGLTSVAIPNSVTSIGREAFYGCRSLTSVTIGNSVTSIGSGAFWGCSGLTSVAIPNTVTSIGGYTFNGCQGLKSVTISNSVTSIGEWAFGGCSGLTSMTIPNSVTSIGNMAFYGCSGLTSLTIGNSVTSIGGGAFRGCKGLTSVTIPNSVTSIGDMAFYECSGLTKVHITDIAKWCSISFSYGTNPLYYANHLYLNGVEITDLVIPNYVTTIGGHAFDHCSGLTSVTIPNSVTSIGEYVFNDCDGLKQISSHIKDVSKVKVARRAFMGVNVSKCVLKLPVGTAKAYRATVPWSEFKKIVEDKKL